jgi:hypothetical protein
MAVIDVTLFDRSDDIVSAIDHAVHAASNGKKVKATIIDDDSETFIAVGTSDEEFDQKDLFDLYEEYKAEYMGIDE